MAKQATPWGMIKRRRGMTPFERAGPAKRMRASGARLIVTLLLATSPCAFVVIPSPAAQNNRGAQLAAMCAACHRLDGMDKGIPTIIGMDEKKLTELMAEFKSGKRASQIMSVVARSLSDEEVADLAKYLAGRQKGSEHP
jgi:sulfide dehydrogenase cytochrome subunit